MATIQLPYADSASLDPTLVVALAVDALATGRAPDTQPAQVEPPSVGTEEVAPKPAFEAMTKDQLLAYCSDNDPANAADYSAMLKAALLIEAQRIWDGLNTSAPT